MNQQQVEQLRWATLEYMACRSTCAFSATQILKGMNANGVGHQIGASLDEGTINAVLYFLGGEGLCTQTHPPMSAIFVYQATSKGVTAWERKRIEQEA